MTEFKRNEFHLSIGLLEEWRSFLTDDGKEISGSWFRLRSTNRALSAVEGRNYWINQPCPERSRRAEFERVKSFLKIT